MAAFMAAFMPAFMRAFMPAFMPAPNFQKDSDKNLEIKKICLVFR